MSATRLPSERAAAARRLLIDSWRSLVRTRKACAAVARDTADDWERHQWERRAERVLEAERAIEDLPEVVQAKEATRG